MDSYTLIKVASDIGPTWKDWGGIQSTQAFRWQWSVLLWKLVQVYLNSIEIHLHLDQLMLTSLMK